jgi:hypothetical protein
MRKNVIRRIWEEAGRFRSKTGVDPTVVYLGAEELSELQEMRGVLVLRPVAGTWVEGWQSLSVHFSGRELLQVLAYRYLAVGI